MNNSTRIKSFINKTIALLLLISILITMPACSTLTINVQAKDLMVGVKAKSVQGKAADERFISAAADFSVNLFKKIVAEKENSLISPLSVLLALAMTANGADGNTLKQMQEVLGGDIPLDELNDYLYSYVKNLPSEKKSELTIANSIWFRDDKSLTVNKDFLQKNADYYNTAAYKSAFDDQTIKDINNWVKSNTDGVIDKIIDKISPYTVMFLINAIVFDARWDEVYHKEDISDGNFTAIDGSKQNVKFMKSEENTYLDDGKATGFIKPYYANNYSFVALLPNEDVPIKNYISSLTGESFLNIINKNKYTIFSASMPKFKYDYSIHMNNALKTLGMPDAFSNDQADFSKIGHSTLGNMYIGDVLHKTFIQVDELGTKAGAVTKVQIDVKSAPAQLLIELNRPFVYAIIDNSTKLPVFLGAVMNMQ